ncbi:LapA family protein [Streptomyces sp. NBC_00443]|uniref:LapA family protein n=1 Tax=Streptomyces sp. NBC_00443 TaxID=2975743 RepID=UPI002E2110A3
MTAKTSESGRKADGHRGGVRGAMTPARVAVLVLVVLALIFIFENTGETEIRLLIPLVTMPLWVALLAVGIIGALFGAYFMRRRR